MNVETKKQLRERVSYLERIVDEQNRQEEELQQEHWKSRLGKAYSNAKAELNATILGSWRNLRLDHIDSSGYWFIYELYQGCGKWDTVSICIRHWI